jgi:hypothetical protein
MRHLLLAGGLMLGLATVTFADQWDKKTEITVNDSIMVPGKVLPPGKYVIKLLDSSSDRHIVQIFNADQSKLEVTILAFPNERLDPTGKTVLRYWETPAGVPPAIRAWFYPGDNFGQEFAYPKDEVARIEAANQGATVPVDDRATAANNAPATTPAPAQPAPQVASAIAPPADTVSSNPAPVVTQPAAPDNSALLAQNTPAPEPVQAPAQAAPAPATPDSLPQTATPLPGFFLAGMGLLTIGELLKRVRSY